MPKRYVPNDAWSRKAAEEGYRARSVYKLQEIDEKFRLIKQGMIVVDLGAMPGSWSQYTAKKLKGSGRIVAVDLQEMEPIDDVETFVADISNVEEMNKILPAEIHLILSDLAPKTSGIQDVDQWKSIELSQAVMEIAKDRLTPGGKCVIKVLRGGDFDEFLKNCKKEWKEVKTFSAKASRDRSKEIYVILRK